MSRTFKIDREPYDYYDFIYTKDEFTFEPGVTVLVGCNGIGKTTLLKQIKYQLEKQEIPFLSYDNLNDGGSTALTRAIFYGSADLAGSLFCASEGEQIAINIANRAGQIGVFFRNEVPDAKEVWLIFDAIDSGLSIDNIVELKEDLFSIIFEMNQGKDIYIVVSANEYEMCRGEKCFDTQNGEYIEFKTYDQYRRFVLNSRKQKDNRRKKPRKSRKRGGQNEE